MKILIQEVWGGGQSCIPHKLPGKVNLEITVTASLGQSSYVSDILF